MRIFVAGASGAIGTRLVAQLVDRGHEVIGTYRVPAQRRARAARSGRRRSRSTCSTRRAVREAVLEAAPDAIVHQATALADMPTSQHFDRSLRADEPAADRGHRRAARRRARGGRAALRRPELRQRPLRARRRAGQDRGRPARSRPGRRRRARATPRCATSTSAVTDAGGIALRYGGFYGAANDGLVEPVRKRQFPIVGDGGGVISFIHLDDAAAATVLALEHDGRRHLQHRRRRARARSASGSRSLAEVLGAKPPRHVPRWLARLVAGEAAVMLGTESRGASNAKAKRELGWEPRYPSWREGFVAAYAPTEQAPSVRLREVA